MIIKTHFEKMAPGMKAKLDPRYRISKNHLFDDYDAIKRELLNNNMLGSNSPAQREKTTSPTLTEISH